MARAAVVGGTEWGCVVGTIANRASTGAWTVAWSALAGAVSALGFPPVDQAAFGLAGLAGGLLALRSARCWRTAAASGVAFGAGLFGAVLVWSLRFGAEAYLALVLVQAVFLVPVGVVAARPGRRWSGRWAVEVAAVWTLTEAVRARWPVGGFEWGQLGYLWHDTPVRGVAALIGVLGVTAATVLTVAGAVAAVSQLRRRHSPDRSTCAAVVSLPLLALTAAAVGPWTDASGTLDVAVVQVAPVCPGPVVDCPSEDRRLLASHAAATESLTTAPDVVVWGEGALGGPSIEAAGLQVRRAMPGAPRVPVLAGVTAPAGEGGFINANVLYDAEGNVVSVYAKRHPVPFGEYVPARDILGGVGDVGRLVPADMVRGRRPGRLGIAGARLGTVSSFELSFAREVRTAVAGNGGVVALTSEASYGRSAVSDQLLAMAQLRAAELDKPVLVAATTGRSALVRADGSIGRRTPLMSPAVLMERVVVRRGATPYATTGDLPAVVIAAAAAALGVRRRGAAWIAARRRETTRVPVGEGVGEPALHPLASSVGDDKAAAGKPYPVLGHPPDGRLVRWSKRRRGLSGSSAAGRSWPRLARPAVIAYAVAAPCATRRCSGGPGPAG